MNNSLIYLELMQYSVSVNQYVIKVICGKIISLSNIKANSLENG